MDKEAKVEEALYEPDYENECCHCGAVPTVVINSAEGVVALDMCGACTWGEASAIDPANW